MSNKAPEKETRRVNPSGLRWLVRLTVKQPNVIAAWVGEKGVPADAGTVRLGLQDLAAGGLDLLEQSIYPKPAGRSRRPDRI